eukprot:1877182-Prymnesium_polylepis.1
MHARATAPTRAARLVIRLRHRQQQPPSHRSPRATPSLERPAHSPPPCAPDNKIGDEGVKA